MAGGIDVLDPVDFVGPGGRLFLDTNVFMDTDPKKKGRMGALLRRCGETILANDNPLVVVTKVVDELTTQSRKVDPERMEAIEKARIALQFLEDAEMRRLVRTDVGDPTNPYVDDLFVRIFQIYSSRYDMCLLTNDVTLQLRIKLLEPTAGKRLIAGVLTREGFVEVRSAQALYEKGLRKLNRKRTEGDQREVDVLEPLLAEFQREFGTTSAEGCRVVPPPVEAPRSQPDLPPAVVAFSGRAKFKGSDQVLDVGAIPGVGDSVRFESPAGNGTLVLGEVLGEGGEGTAFGVEGGRVVKVFGRDQITQHRKEKLTLLSSRNLRQEGICFPEAVVTNPAGEFVGYLMPKARGDEFRVIMNPRRFRKVFPGWKKADLVDVCISFLEKVAYLHSLNVILGDINPKNLMVDADKGVWIIDADSWQLEGYPCPVGTPMFTGPSALGKPYAESLRTMEEELFAVATMLFMVLITGLFPYARAGSDGDMVRLIKEGNFAFQFGERSNRDQPEGNWKYMWSHMTPDLKEMFWHTFHREGKYYSNPPTVNEWMRAFRQYKWWLGSDRNFDPMSNDVYPFRFKAFRPDTPIHDCPQCGRSNAIVGDWNDTTQTYYVRTLCFDCGQENRPRCLDCGSPKPEGALREGRCRDCNRKRDFGECERCGKSTPLRSLVGGRCSNCQIGVCKSCGQSFLRSDLSYGRCNRCEKRAKELDPSRLCVDCHQPFITFDHADWFTTKGLDVAKSHTAIKGQCPRATSTRPTAMTRQVPTAITPPAAKRTPAPAPTSQPKQGFWARLKKWLQDS